MTTRALAIVGGGPAGLMAAEAAAETGSLAIDLYEAMPSVGRKFLMAGKSGLNLTHAEPADRFLARFGDAAGRLQPILTAFGQQAVRDWAAGLGIETFVGSSGRVFPTDFKAAPLLRAWVRRLKAAGVRFHVRHRWQGWDRDGALLFETPDGPRVVAADATILALGGASWPQLGSDGAWVDLLQGQGASVEPLQPANCGFEIAWSDHFRDRIAGQPVKPVVTTSAAGSVRGEFVVTAHGVEGGAIYPHAAALREACRTAGSAALTLDLAPGKDEAALVAALGRPRGSRSVAEHLRRSVGIEGVKAGLLREVLGRDLPADPAALAQAIKALPLSLLRPRPIAEAISSAGGLCWTDLDEGLMMRNRPGLFAAGEMLDWEATTGGDLLTACLATGRWAGRAAAALLVNESPSPLEGEGWGKFQRSSR